MVDDLLPSTSPSSTPADPAITTKPTPTYTMGGGGGIIGVGGKKGERINTIKKIAKIIAYVIVFVVCMAFIIYYAKKFKTLLDDIKELKLLGNLIIIVSYIPAGLPFAFISYYVVLSLATGNLYGYVAGFATTMLGSVGASMVGFWVTRAFCRAWLEEKIKASQRLSALMLAMEHHAFKVTFILRFLPLPFGLQNGLCAMTSITPTMYLLSSTIGLLPENLVLVYFGNSINDIEEVKFGDIPTYEKIFLVVAVVVMVGVVVMGRKMLDSTLAMARAGNKKIEDIELLRPEEGRKKENGSISDDEEEEANHDFEDSYRKESTITITTTIPRHIDVVNPSPLKLSAKNIIPDPPPSKNAREKRIN